MGGEFKSFSAQMWLNAKRLPAAEKSMSLIGVQEGPGRRRELLVIRGEHLCLSLARNTPALACFKAVKLRAGRWMFVTVTYSVRRLGKAGGCASE